MNLRIRIADDEELIRKSLVKLLTAEGYEVDAVGSAAEVLESVRNDPPQILILDLRLPDGSGLELLPRLKSIEPDLKVVVITAFGDLPTAVQAMRQGATDFIKKPYEMHEMVLAIERLKAGIAREHGGNLTARNSAQGGAVFKFSLPALLSPDGEDAKE